MLSGRGYDCDDYGALGYAPLSVSANMMAINCESSCNFTYKITFSCAQHQERTTQPITTTS